VFLANILPELQLGVLSQIEGPKLTACDTMNFYIEGYRADLMKTIASVDAIILNDAECRQLTGKPILLEAGRATLEMGPGIVIVKKGEHGAMMFTRDSFFSAPAYPCESLFDPTGAGDSFAGGFMGYLAKTGDTSRQNIRRAVIYGTVMASFCVEQFSVAGMASLSQNDIDARYRDLKEISHFEL
jgi:sugar/nucleoside kinase (ribokinase family)